METAAVRSSPEGGCMDATVLLWLLAAILVLAGLLGLLLPVLPGPPLLFAGLLAAAWAEDFVYVGAGTLSLLAALALLTYAVDFAATALGAKRFGASKRAVIGAAVGAVVGLFFGLPGILFGPFIGAVIGELTAQRGLSDAGRAGVGATLGLVLGVAAKLALAFSMLGLFALVRIVWGAA
jgi:uncharacterized protein YqgC (DUF456 family)